MTIRITRRRIIGSLVALTLVGALAGTVALRAAKRAAANGAAHAG